MHRPGRKAVEAFALGHLPVVKTLMEHLYIPEDDRRTIYTSAVAFRGAKMDRFEHIEGTWRRPSLNMDDVPKEFVDWWRTVPQDFRHSYLYGGMYSMVVAFKKGQQVEAERTRLQIERLTKALDATLTYVQSTLEKTAPANAEAERVMRDALAALGTRKTNQALGPSRKA